MTSSITGYQPGRSSGVVDTSGISDKELLAKIEALEASNNELANSACSVYRKAAIKIPSAAFTEIKCDTAIFDTGGHFNLATGRYIVPSTGFYWMFVQIEAAINTAGQILIASVFRNGGEALRGNRLPTSATEMAALAAGINPANAGDELYPAIFQNGAECNLAISAEGQKNRFSVIRVS